MSKKFAVIRNGIVINIIVAESKAVAEEVTRLECIEYTDENPAIVGLNWDGTSFEQHPYDYAEVFPEPQVPLA